MAPSPMCLLCDVSKETIEHMLFECPHAKLTCISRNSARPDLKLAAWKAKKESPPRGSFKINSDAAWIDEDKEACISCMIHNFKGHVVDGFAKKVFCSSALVAEALALCQAISFAGNIGATSVIFEIDAQAMIGYLSDVLDNIPWKIQSHILFIKDKVSLFVSQKVRFVLRT
ncbi:conserved hypothetical protein [Ricinus communis]|uniref:RNase H type-1 domain-containing protein n=1 Tax=Ricinus communis TaxID=3988 RepID=B9SM26_RICCO|nr:conserved hypothetical protein [Ricinus communis]